MRLLPLELRPGDREVLEGWARAGTVEARIAKRARIVVLAADGVPNRQIGTMVDMHYNQVAVWRRRYAEPGLAGLGDEERPGRPFVYSHDDVLLLVKTVTEPPPDQATRWTMEALAAVMAAHGVPISASQIWRIWRGLDLKPWPVQSWMTSHDPDFWEKAADVCGLYLGPPTNAVVWSVDEKTSIQAKARVNPTVRAAPGRKERRELEYERNGTAVLFAGLKVHEGTVAGWVTGSTCSDNFVTTCTASSTTWPPIRPTKSKNSSISTPGPTCTTRLPTRRGSTKSSCFSPSWNVGYCAAASSSMSTTWLGASSRSSRTTTAVQPRSVGPTRAAPSKSRKSQ
jgi:transposase